MYKKMSLDELTTVQTGFFDHIKKLYTKRQHMYFKSFLQETCAECCRTYFFENNKPFFRVYSQDGGQYRFVDEVEKVDVTVDESGVQRIHNLLKDVGQMRTMEKNKSLLEQLEEAFIAGDHTTFMDKPFIVYDVETTFAPGGGLSSQYFEMAYSIDSRDASEDDSAYEYVDRDMMKLYCDKLLAYDGRIIGYNQIAFDNPVLVANVGYGETELEELNRKSLDPFLLLWKLTGRRMGLDAVSSALISTGKTLSSGKEGADYLAKYKQTGNPKLWEKVKDYCKNDVKITLGVFLYLLAYQTVQFGGKTHNVSPELFLDLGGWSGAGKEDPSSQSGRSFAS